MPEILQQEEKKAINDCKKILVKNLKANLPRSDGAYGNYDGSMPYKHIADDIKAVVKNKDGIMSLTIYGGKMTGFKWHMVNDGTRDKQGRVHTKATHFIDNAINQSTAEINRLIDNIINEVAQC